MRFLCSVNHGGHRANAKRLREARAKLTNEDMLSAMQGLGLSNYRNALSFYLQRKREVIPLLAVFFLLNLFFKFSFFNIL